MNPMVSVCLLTSGFEVKNEQKSGQKRAFLIRFFEAFYR